MSILNAVKKLGKPIAFHPGLAKIVGIKEAIFFQQLTYWSGVTTDPEGWIYKSVKDWEDETTLTKKEQSRIRDKLLHNDLIEEKHARSEHRIYFRISSRNEDNFQALFDSGMPAYSPPKKEVSDQKDHGGQVTKGHQAGYQRSLAKLPKVTSPRAGVPYRAESTTENTTQNDFTLQLNETTKDQSVSASQETANGAEDSCCDKKQRPRPRQLVDPQTVLDAWNEAAARNPTLPKKNRVVEGGKTAIALGARVKEPAWVAEYEDALEVAASLNWNTPGWDGRVWVANFDWFVRKGSPQKLIEGKFVWKKQLPGHGLTPNATGSYYCPYDNPSGLSPEQLAEIEGMD